MKRILVALLVGMSILIAPCVYADKYEAEWIAKCIEDNKNANVSAEVITKYCTCMTRKMERSETRSVSEWEKTHPQERAECDKESGWK